MKTQLLFMDVDGTLTDGKLYIGRWGEMMKAFSVKDGQGITSFRKEFGGRPVILTGRKSKILIKRCRELKICSKDVHQGKKDKVSVLKDYANHYPVDSFAYIGDDINDIPCIEFVRSGGGVTACPCDAVEPVKQVVDYVCRHQGGDGAVRDFLDYLVLGSRYE